jgi:hypothetical protein
MSILRSRASSRHRLRVSALVLIPCALAAACSVSPVEESSASTREALTPGVLGDVNGDGRADIALMGGPGWNTIPVAYSNGDGTFRVTNLLSNFEAFAAVPGAQPLAGDFNGDGRTDLAVTGGSGWNTLPVAFSNGDGTFAPENLGIYNFAADAAVPGATAVVGDFDGDGKSDIALTGGQGWNTVPVALSNGNGTFRTSNLPIVNFAADAQVPGARLVATDFDGDGRTDLALVGGQGWNTVPVAFSNGNGSFRVTNYQVTNFPEDAAVGALAVAGDFDGDGRGDIALTGGRGWNTIPIAFSNGDGTFRVTNTFAPSFPEWAAAGAQALAADFNGDGRADLALTGGQGWNTLPVAFSNGDGSFRVSNDQVPSVPSWATASFALSASDTRLY